MTKQQRYMVRLSKRVFDTIDVLPRVVVDKYDIAKLMGFKSTHNVSSALGMLFQKGRIDRIAAGCKNAQGLESAPALYVRK